MVENMKKEHDNQILENEAKTQHLLQEHLTKWKNEKSTLEKKASEREAVMQGQNDELRSKIQGLESEISRLSDLNKNLDSEVYSLNQRLETSSNKL